MSNCINNIFNNEDFKLKLNKNDIRNHNYKESPWIFINNNIYSLNNNNFELLTLFKDHFGKDVKKFLLNNFNNKQRIIILNKLKNRKIGSLIK